MMHDFAVTKKHAIFPFFPLKTDLDRLKAGGPHWVWDFDEKETVMGIMPRDGDVSEMRWFRGPAAISFHFMNAFDEGDTVHLDFGVSEMAIFPFMQRDSGIEPGPPGPGRPAPASRAGPSTCRARPIPGASGSSPRPATCRASPTRII